MARSLARHLMTIAIVYTLALLFIGFFVGRASAHDEYSTWKTPQGMSCCNGHDCRPVTATLDKNGDWIANVDGRRIRVPASKVLKIPSPDGRSHWCGQGDATFCFVPAEIRG